MKSNRSKKSKGAATKVDTLVGNETEILGDVHFAGGLHVDGVIKGNVHADGESKSAAIISERARIEGELRVPNLMINGFVAGDVYAAERLDLASNARVSGDVYYRTMEMASGAEINGKLVRSDETPQRFLEHQEAPPVAAEARNDEEIGLHDRDEAESDADREAQAGPESSA